MVLDFLDALEAGQRIWKCLSCGLEIFFDASRRAEDELQLARVLAEEGQRPRPQALR
jgi:hypothetical protein